jgi:hypothetical protein
VSCMHSIVSPEVIPDRVSHHRNSPILCQRVSSAITFQRIVSYQSFSSCSPYSYNAPAYPYARSSMYGGGYGGLGYPRYGYGGGYGMGYGGYRGVGMGYGGMGL